MTESEEPPAQGWAAEPVDPDIADTAWPTTSRKSQRQEQLEVLVAVSIGGVAGASARYGASLIWPTMPGHFPWTTFWVNVVGCGLMGVLMVLVTERFAAHPLVRPLLGTGVLGGFTTFSTYTVDTQRLLVPATSGTALLYMVLTLIAAVAAVWVSTTATRVVALPRGPR